MTWRRHAMRLAGPPVLSCPECGGQGELWVSGDPRGPNVETRECWLCHGEAFVPVAAAEDHQAMTRADENRRLAPPEPASCDDPWAELTWPGTDLLTPPPF